MAISAIVGAVGIAGAGLSAYGTVKSTEASKKIAESNQEVAVQEQQAAAIQKQQADLQNSRYRMQLARQSNLARATALSNATNSGSEFGSGLQGGYGQISGEENVQMLGASQNQLLTNSLYNTNQNISNLRIQQQGYNSDYYTGMGFTSLGGSLISAMGSIGKLAGGINFGSQNPSGSGYTYGPGYGYSSNNYIY